MTRKQRGRAAGVKVLSVRRQPECLDAVRDYVKARWASTESGALYDDRFAHCRTAPGPLPPWYGLEEDGRLMGCGGMIPNDFISRMDLWPWLCALYIDPDDRGHGYGGLEEAARDAGAGFDHLYLCTGHVGHYEKHGFTFLGMGHHPWGERSRIYGKALV